VVVVESAADNDQLFWLARYLHQYGSYDDRQRSLRLFSGLNNRYRYHEKIVDYAQEGQKRLVFQGRVKNYLKDALIIEADATGDTLIAPANLSDDKIFRHLHPGQRISYTLGYRYRGPVACTLEGV
jgi:hypothetical protein